MKDYTTKTFWVKLYSGQWVVAERRYSNRWFTCGNEFVKTVGDPPYRNGDIVEIGKEVVCPYTR